MNALVDSLDLGDQYRQARERIRGLVGEEVSAVAVPACPGWTVHDVLAHLTAVCDDVLAGKLTRPPTDDETAEQVGRRRDVDMVAMLDEWDGMAGQFESLLTSLRVWPGMIDVLSHEQDIRAAIGQAGARDVDGIVAAAAWSLRALDPGREVVVDLGAEVQRCGSGEPGLVLHSDPYEVFRFRLGRRSRAQLAAMRWEGDPSSILDRLVIFGPSATDQIE